PIVVLAVVAALATPGTQAAAERPTAASTATPEAARSPADGRDDFLDQYAATLRFTLEQPTKIQVTPEGDAVLFLRSGPRSFVADLWQLDVASRQERVLLTADGILKGADESLSVAERARRERQRIATRGI